MNCPRHPEKVAVARCERCGSGLCINCVRETDQTSLCPACFFESRGEEEGAVTGKPVVPAETAGTAGEEKPVEEKRRFGRGIFSFPGKKRAAGEAEPAAEEEPPRKEAEPGRKEEEAGKEVEDFLSRGPDMDFSLLEEKRKPRRKQRLTRRAARAEKPAGKTRERRRPFAGREGVKERPSGRGEREDELIEDVVAALVSPSAPAVEIPGKRQAAEEKVPGKEAGESRWSFLAQPRVNEYTVLAPTWWKAALFILLMLLLGMVLWALPNAFLFPGDREYGIHAIAVGIVLGLLFWWKAGKTHGTKLAVQAALTTLFALMLGEFLHWFLIIVKFKAFRTIFFDLISFKFIWENGAEILRLTAEAMFPLSFLWILLLPTLMAFIIGFGMPPIPEIFAQIRYAAKGQSPK